MFKTGDIRRFVKMKRATPDESIGKGRMAGENKQKTLDEFFAVASSEYVCCVCGKGVKCGLRRTHENKCRVQADDDEIIIVKEIKAAPRPLCYPRPPLTRIRKRSQQYDEDWKETEDDREFRPCRKRLRSGKDGSNDNGIGKYKSASTSISSAMGQAYNANRDAFSDASSIELILDSKDREQDTSIYKGPVIISVQSLAVSPLASSQFTQLRLDSSALLNQSGSDSFVTALDEDNTLVVTVEEECEKMTPFVLKAFRDIVMRVRHDQFHSHLFDETDKNIIDIFVGLLSGAQLLFCRLMTRKRAWISVASLKKSYGGYPGVGMALDILEDAKLLDSVDKMSDLKEALNIFHVAQLQAMVKSVTRASVPPRSTKQNLIETLLVYSRGQSALTGTTKDSLMKRIKDEIGKCYRIADDAYLLFLCLLHLFSPEDMSSRNLADGKRKSISQLISNLVHILRQKHAEMINFPSRTGIRHVHQFRSREELQMYVKVNVVEAEIREAFVAKRYQDCSRINVDSLEQLKTLIVTDSAEYITRPSHLRQFTAPRVLFRIVDIGVQCLEKQRKYTDAVDQLWEMIEMSSGHWCPSSRSRWYDRLALNLDAHLKKREQALQVIEKAVNDERVMEDVRLSLCYRAERIVRSIKSHTKKKSIVKLTRQLASLKKSVAKMKIPERKINGTLLAKTLGGRNKTVFATVNSEDGSVTMRNVEEVAKRYYIHYEGFTDGIHGEGSPWVLLFGLFFWDIVNDASLPDTFICSQQWMPLDLNDQQFYARRKEKLDERMNWIKESSLEERLAKLGQCWRQNHGNASALINWTLFDDLTPVERIVSCIDPAILVEVFTRFVSGIPHVRSGLPDLLLWDYNKRSFKVVEVKGPGDRLSMKQRLWLNFFVKIGAHAEVCYVKGVPGKRAWRKSNMVEDEDEA